MLRAIRIYLDHHHHSHYVYLSRRYIDIIFHSLDIKRILQPNPLSCKIRLHLAYNEKKTHTLPGFDIYKVKYKVIIK